MKLPLLLRRVHLYLGLALAPWVVMYGLSSAVFTHGEWFRKAGTPGTPQWTLRETRAYDAAPPADAAALRGFGLALLQELGVTAPNVGVNRPNGNTVNITAFSFLHTTRVVYSIPQKKVTVEDRQFRFDMFLTGMHSRGGFNQEGFLPDTWAVMVDVVCVAMILWILTGLYLWWGVSGHRLWGLVALLAGAGAFALFVFRL
jgi:hypothetical protein